MRCSLLGGGLEPSVEVVVGGQLCTSEPPRQKKFGGQGRQEEPGPSLYSPGGQMTSKFRAITRNSSAEVQGPVAGHQQSSKASGWRPSIGSRKPMCNVYQPYDALKEMVTARWE